MAETSVEPGGGDRPLVGLDGGGMLMGGLPPVGVMEG